MTVVALAGRRIDAKGATPARFPLAQAKLVENRLETLLRTAHPTALVCSAACGADLLALEAAAKLDIPVTIVLPFEPQRFRGTSVADRPGKWGPRFDMALARVAQDHIHVIEPADGDDDAYARATDAILEDAEELAAKTPGGGSDLVAVVVWDGVSRGEGDLTDLFRQNALARGFTVREISTLSSA
jgi:hypothetical protein